MTRRYISITLAERNRRASHTTWAASAALALFAVVMGKTSAAFLAPTVSTTMMISSRRAYYRLHQAENNSARPGNNMVASVMEDDELFEVWAKRNAGKYDKSEFQNAINALRAECRLTIHALENEIAGIRKTLRHQEFDQSQFSSSDETHFGSDDVDDTGELVPTLKAVFVGYEVTEDDRKRLPSAHPGANYF